MTQSDDRKSGYERSKEASQERGRERTRRAVEAYEANPKYCLHCGTKLSFAQRTGKFCSQSCAASYNNTRKQLRETKRSRFCQCGKPKVLQNKYCSECSKKQVYRTLTFEQLRQDRSRRAWLIKERGHRCEVCGLSEWRGKPIAIEIDHIDGNADNNSKDNLRLICPNCHAQTETYKGANVGKESTRQKMRRRRYKNGQTY